MKSVGVGRPTCETNRQHQIRLNGLPRLDSVFDQLIAQPKILPYLHEFVGQPQQISSTCPRKFSAQGIEELQGIPHTLPERGYFAILRILVDQTKTVSLD